jgi:hypothetical protein
MKILYAAGNNFHAKIQLERFLENFDVKNNIVKVAAYKKYLSSNYQTNWTLDCCLTPDKDNNYLFYNNKYLDIYEEQIKDFKPDLIISDLEIYSSFLSLKLNIKLWHVSNKLHNFALPDLYKDNIKVHKYYKFLYGNSHSYKNIVDIVDGADKNFVYSHFCDIDEKIFLKENFDWVRPYYYTGKKSVVYEHKYVSVDCNKINIIKYLSEKKSDCVVFSDNVMPYENITAKPYSNKEEYGCNLSNCEIFVCGGEASLLADAFYNKRKIKIFPDQASRENIFNYLIYNNIYNYMIEDDLIIPSEISFDSNVKFLHEKIIGVR